MHTHKQTNDRSLSLSLSQCVWTMAIEADQWSRCCLVWDRIDGRSVVDVSDLLFWNGVVVLLLVVACSCCCLFHAPLLVRATIVVNGSIFVAGISVDVPALLRSSAIRSTAYPKSSVRLLVFLLFCVPCARGRRLFGVENIQLFRFCRNPFAFSRFFGESRPLVTLCRLACSFAILAQRDKCTAAHKIKLQSQRHTQPIVDHSSTSIHCLVAVESHHPFHTRW